MYSLKDTDRTDDGVDNEHGRMECGCGAVLNYTGWTAPETIGWFELHDAHAGIAVDVTKDCSCGLLDHPRGCAPVGCWA